MSGIDQTPETRPSLILRLRDPDDLLAWREFLEIYEPTIRGMARKRGLQSADIDDITQEVLTRIAQSIERWEPDRSRGSFRGWLATTTRNVVIDSFRKRSRMTFSNDEQEIDALTDDAEFDLETERQLFQWAARKIQHRFEAKTWKAFWLTAVEGQTASLTAQQLGTTTAQIYVARSRVMTLLKTTIQRSQFDAYDD